MSDVLEAILRRRAIKVFDPVKISTDTREQVLHAARVAPSSFNIQPYRFYWVETPETRSEAARLCFGQSPAATASALVVAVADIGSWKSTTASELAWMRTAGFPAKKIADYERRAKFGKWFFIQGWFGVFGLLKWAILRVVHLWKTIGTLPVARQGMFKWATKSASLACQNLMIAAEALGLNTCPMEGFDGRRLGKMLGLSGKNHEIVMVIAIGKKIGAACEPAAVAQAAGRDGADRMIIVDKKLIPQEILKDSVLVHLASAYFSVGKKLEQKTKCSQTRGFIMSTLRGGAALNQNQIATMLGFDRTVVHRAIKTMIHEGLLSERKADTGRALLVQLTAKGNKYREGLVKERRAAEDKLRKELTAGEASTLIRLLQRIAELEL